VPVCSVGTYQAYLHAACCVCEVLPGALRFAEEGAFVVAGDVETLPREGGEPTADLLGDRGAFVRADASRWDDVDRLVGRAVEQGGRLDVMVCNAGIGYYGSVEDTPPDVMQRMMDVNYMGTFYGARAAMPVFRRQGSGHVIIVSSIVGKRGVPYMGAYSATKFAQVGLAECLRAELAGTGIHVSVVYPVSTDTEFFDVMVGETGAAVSRAFGPRQHVDTVADAIARAIARPVAEVYPHRLSRGLAIMNALAPAFTDRFVQRFGRKPVK